MANSATIEVHDPAILANARAVLDACRSAGDMRQAVLDAVHRNETWRGQQCINLLAPEAPTSPTVRALLASEVGTRAAEGHIGAVNRWFVGTQHIDEIEALCMELLKQVFRTRYADHRLMGSMLGNMAVYTALTQPGDVIMTVAQPVGGHSSNRADGPAGVRGLKIVDIPMDPIELEVDLDLFRKLAPLVRPKVVTLGVSMTLFPFPVRAMREVVDGWGGHIFFDGAHQLGLIAGGQFQDPIREGASVLTGFSMLPRGKSPPAVNTRPSFSSISVRAGQAAGYIAVSSAETLGLIRESRPARSGSVTPAGPNRSGPNWPSPTSPSSSATPTT